MSEERDDGPDDLDDLLGIEPEEPEPEPGEEPEPEPAEPEPAEPAEPQPQSTRAEKTIRALRRQSQEQATELKQLREAVLRAAPQPAAQPQADPYRQAQLDREEAERVAQLPYDEQARYWNRKTEERVQQQILRSNLETRDMLDKNNFQQIMRDRKLPARYATAVENLLSQARQQGMNPTREWLMKTVIGDEVLAKKDRETDRQRTSGRRRIASQTTRPGATGSTAAAGTGRRERNSAAEDDALLSSITLGEFLRGA